MAALTEKFASAEQFYPTPVELAESMKKLIDWKHVSYTLEPSAGKGDLCKYGILHHGKDELLCIELDNDLCSVLRDKGYSVVQGDFLKFKPEVPVDCIVMNPPFKNGAAHLLHAISIIADSGGQIVCLLNAETLKKSNVSKERTVLAQLLHKYNAGISYIDNAFLYAERRTDVEVALVYIDIPKKPKRSAIFEKMKQSVQHGTQGTEQANWLDNKDVIIAMVQQYQVEINSGKTLIQEYEAMSPYILTDLKDCSWNKPILSLELKNSKATVAGYVRAVRRKYWSALYKRPEFIKRFTKDLQDTLCESISDMENYEFSLANIRQMYQNLNDNLMSSLNDTILNMFEKLTYKNSMDCAGNIQYYDGWRTNDAYKINKRVVIPCYNTWSDWYKKFEFGYNLQQFLLDIERVFTYLGGNLPDSWSVASCRETYYDTFKKVEFGYFYVTLYKKGTCHLEFKDERLVKRLNLYGAMRKGWLPNSYGYKTYEQMNREEQAVVDSFEGKEQYMKDLKSVNAFLTTQQNNSMRMLTG